MDSGCFERFDLTHRRRSPKRVVQSCREKFQRRQDRNDDDREFAYAEKNGASLKAAKEGDWHVVSMKNDWKLIFAEK